MQVILRHCPICSQDSIVGHGRRRKQAHDQHHDWIGIRRGLCNRCGNWKAIPGKPRRLPSKTPIAWPIPPRYADDAEAWILLSRRFPSCARRSGRRRVAHQNRDSRARFAFLALAYRIPVSHAVLALADLERSRRPPSSPGKRAEADGFCRERMETLRQWT